MAIMFRRGLAIPLWAVVLCAVALGAWLGAMPFGIALLGIAAIASTTMAIAAWLRTSRPHVEMGPAVREDRAHAGIIMTARIGARTLDEALRARMPEPDDTLDLVRMDDDGGWQRAPPQPALNDGASHGHLRSNHV